MSVNISWMPLSYLVVANHRRVRRSTEQLQDSVRLPDGLYHELALELELELKSLTYLSSGVIEISSLNVL